MNSTTK